MTVARLRHEPYPARTDSRIDSPSDPGRTDSRIDSPSDPLALVLARRQRPVRSGTLVVELAATIRELADRRHAHGCAGAPGTVTAKSELGRGSCFTVELPLRTPDEMGA
jgi:hypothetical protein